MLSNGTIHSIADRLSIVKEEKQEMRINVPQKNISVGKKIESWSNILNKSKKNLNTN